MCVRALMQAGPHVRKLSIYQLGLQSDTHANTPWPWEQLNIEYMQPIMLLRLPSPGTSLHGTPVITCARIDLNGLTQVR